MDNPTIVSLECQTWQADDKQQMFKRVAVQQGNIKIHLSLDEAEFVARALVDLRATANIMTI